MAIDISEKHDLLHGQLTNDSWLCRCFMLPPESIDETDLERRIYSPVDKMVGDHTIGGGPVLNMPPGWTENADIPAGFGMQGLPNSGYGTMFGEMVVNNLEVIHIRAGMAEYNSLSAFYSRMYDSQAGTMANTGGSGILSKIINYAVEISAWFIAAPIVAYVKVGRFIRYMTGKPYSAYYYLSPTMDLFWSCFNTSINALAINMGLGLQDEIEGWDENGQPKRDKGYNRAAAEVINNLLPDVYRRNGTIDIYAAATRFTRMQLAYDRWLRSQQEQASSLDEVIEAGQQAIFNGMNSLGNGFTNIVQVMNSFLNTDFSKSKSASVSATEEEQTTTDSTTQTTTTGTSSTTIDPNVGNPQGILNNNPDGELSFYEKDFASHAGSLLAGGGDWISLAVEFEGSTSASFSNSAGESNVSQTINGIVASSRGAKFAIANGNVGDGAITNSLEFVGSAVKAVTSSVANYVGASVVNAMAGNGFVDIPDVWQSSDCEMPKLSYKFTSTAASAHPLAKLQMMVPIVAMICLTAPLSTGSKSYTSPFLLELYHQGKNKISLGMMGNLNLDFGTEDNWDIEKMPTQVTCSFEVVNLSNRVHVPISSDVASAFDDDSTYNDLLKIMGALSLHDQISTTAMLKRKWAGIMTNVSTWTSSSYWANKSVGAIRGDFVNLFLPATKRE